MSDDFEPLLPGIGFSGYRSFATWQSFLFPTKVTVLAGINNSGKSNVLRFLQEVLPALKASAASAPGMPVLDDLDRPRGYRGVETLTVGVPIELGSFGVRQDPRGRGGSVTGATAADFREGYMALSADNDDYYWSRFAIYGAGFEPDRSNLEFALENWPAWEAMHFRRALTSLGGGTVNPVDVMRRIAVSIGGYDSIPNVVTIASARRVEVTEDTEPDWLSGRGIIKALAELQTPTHANWHEARPRWDAINRFVRNVLGDETASLNVPFDFSTVQVETPERVLPLSSLGSGVEQVVVLAAAATVTSKTLVCVEEPETNLHPLLQKKLVRYLTDETDNQYVVATHSSHLLDDERSTVHHVRLTNDGSVAKLVRRPRELIAICNDLGYRPSDLLQANCVIWVEGPSDRTYVRRWLELIDNSLVEGVDYAIMFYGGKLLSHLTASEEALKDFISLRQLNRASVVVIDSDKTSAHKHISATKKRIKREFEEDSDSPGLAWITNCYTIENYVEVDILKAAVGSVHPGTVLQDPGQWDNPLPKGVSSRFDKVGIAAEASRIMTPAALDVLDLRSQIARIRDFVRASNGSSTAPAPL